MRAARKPDAALGLDVLRIEHAAPDWFRVSLLPKYNIRIIFRLLVSRGTTIVELDRYELPEGDERFIDITRAVYRDDATYGQELRRRWRKTRGK